MANTGIAGWSRAPAFNYMPQLHVMSVQPQPIALQQPSYNMPIPYHPFVVSMQPSYMPAPATVVVNSKLVGSVKKWFNEKGFGFITKSDGCDVFVHHSSIRSKGRASLEIGESVEFNIFISDDGREKAMDVTGPGGTFVKGRRELHVASDGGGNFIRKRQVCFDFQNTGNCKFGAKCRYAHEGAVGGYGGNGFKGGEKKLCFTYQQMASCKFGDSCRFAH